MYTMPFSSLPHLRDIEAASGITGANITYYLVGDRIVPVVNGLYDSWQGLRVEDSTFIIRVIW